MKINLREIVSQYLDSKDSSSHEFRRAYNLAVWGMKTEFNLDVTGGIKTVLLTLSPNKTVELPCDYVQYNKVGIVNERGEVITFKRNDQLTNYHQEYYNQTNRTAGVPQFNSLSYGIFDNVGGNGPINTYSSGLYLNYFYTSTSFNLFGLPSGTANLGEYKMDEAKGILMFASDFFYDQILLEYLTDGLDESEEDFQVDVRAAAAVMAYIRWQDVIDKPKKANAATVNRLKLNYYNEKRLGKMRMNKLILNELQDAERRSWKMVAHA